MNINNLNYRPPMTYNEPNTEQEGRTMTKTEAVEILKNAQGIAIKKAVELVGALGMAIEALEQEPSCRNTRQVDLISRQDAIDGLDIILWGDEWDKALATVMIKDLPSADRPTGW